MGVVWGETKTVPTKTVQLLRHFEQTVHKIESINLSADKEHILNFSSINTLAELHGHIKLEVEKYASTSKSTAAVQNVESVQPAKLKLPPLDLPTFNGNFSEWPIFYETFKTMIHENQTLSTEQKVQYLVSKLKDGALNICSGIPAVAANYNAIWDSLLERYQDPRSMAAHYMDVILNFKPIKFECKDMYSKFIDQVGSAVLALKALKIADLSEYILYSLSVKKLEVNLCRRFESKILASKSMPKFTDLLNFVKDETRIMERTDSQGREMPVKKTAVASNVFSFKPNKFQSNKPVSLVSAEHKKGSVSLVSDEHKKGSCLSCKESHSLYSCPDFNTMKPDERMGFAKTHKLCFNCLSPNHSVLSCSNKTSCKKCNYRHHTMLHLDSYKAAAPSREPHSSDTHGNSEVAAVVSCCSSDLQVTKNTVLLSTIKVNILDQYGMPQPVRMLLDSASMSHFITTSCCSKLGIKFKPASLEVGGIGGIASKAKGMTSFSFTSRYDSQKSFIVSEALVVDKITNKLPVCPVDVDQLSHLKDLSLSDDTFHIPDKIDGLIGAELFSDLIGKPKYQGQRGPVVIESAVGDIVMGKVPILPIQNIPLNVCAFVQAPLESIVHKFWTLEEVPTSPQVSDDDKECEEIFIKSCKRNVDGSYCVSIPFKSDPNLLGDSFSIAKKRFLNLERKFDTNPELKQDYAKAIEEYKKNYASKVDMKEIKSPNFVMPHIPIIRTDRITTKTRIVFDLSCPTSSGLSLNDVLHTGPTLYNDLFKLLTTFRLFPYACSGDIKKMFLMVHVCPQDQKYQLFLWRDSPQHELECYQMNRVVFGSKPSPYLAQRVLRQLASDERERYPEAAYEVENHFYMDDYLTSFLDKDEAVRTLSQCCELLNNGGFELTKIASNNAHVLESIPKPLRLTENVQWEDKLYMKVLGIEWCPTEDNFLFKVKVEETSYTKRGILSTVAKIYDVLGLISPVTTYAKIILKELWKLKIDWDQVPPPFICQQWESLVQEFPLLNDYKIPRHLSIFQDTKLNLVGFCDASEKAYGACIYTHVIHTDGHCSVHLVCAKSKVSPVKYVTIPRLELCAALLLAKLMFAVVPMFKEKYGINQVFCFSDSKVAISWIISESSRWKTFVANRVAKIQECVSAEKWFHVKGTENPADCLSRGLTPAELIHHELWSHGPSWLSETSDVWPISHPVEVEEIAFEEEKPTSYVTVSKTETITQGKVLINLALRISSWMKLLRTVCYVLKFGGILPKGKITSQDLNYSEMTVLKAVQHEAFPTDIKNLEMNKNCSDSLQRIHAFQQDGVIRCGGRISNAPHLDYSQVHPVILPKHHHVINLIIDYYHRKNFHTGPHLLIAVLRKKYWILSCRDIVRRQLQKCNTCFRHNPKVVYPPMADLPVARVSECKAFLNTGVDYAGPFRITISRRRGVKSQKAYLCLFVCLATKALHLELASDLSTATFMAALRRFIARRGSVKTIYCDQGTNFVGASNSLDELYTFLSSEEFNDAYSKELLEHRINFKFNPPASPHFGGIWEANVRSVKVHLYKALGEQILTYEMMNSLIIECEAILNSRPLCQVGVDARDPIVLTPAHFLSQFPVDHLPMSDDPRVNTSLGERYKLLNQIVTSFWRRWSSEYLSTLQERFKWNKKDTSSLEVGLLVLIKSENTPVLSWPMGKIVELCPGKDGIIRVVVVKTAQGLFKRPVVKICRLPCQ
uniref:Integrase catalytic domain-containing protein n=1 Tax=Cacopsylla melanoneura TaxID=428564 RepID=A0A8D8WAG5_9HEMI